MYRFKYENGNNKWPTCIEETENGHLTKDQAIKILVGDLFGLTIPEITDSPKKREILQLFTTLYSALYGVLEDQ